MKTEHLYVIIDSHAACWRIVEEGTETASLPGLLADGWRPIRETAFVTSGYILICLEREPEAQAGFGFGSS